MANADEELLRENKEWRITMRKSGILLPVTSLPSQYGIGCFSKEAYQFVDFLKKAGQSYWQILPLGPTGYGDSPYQSFSTFAGNPYLIDLEGLIRKGWLTEEECARYDFGQDSGYVDYEKIYLSRFRILFSAYQNSHIGDNKKFRDFVRNNRFWLEDYALYMALKDASGGSAWSEWAEDLKRRRAARLEECRKTYQKEIMFYQFQQFVFYEQWRKLKKYANQNGIRIIGDVPIYVAFDSADTWANPEIFQFDRKLRPTGVAGCPPDGFSANGQLWGNPLYRWEYHKKTGYRWWVQRMAHCYRLYDVVRVDHFRGFDSYYTIPYGAETAREGKWKKGPGYRIFQTLKARLGKKDIIAEDLGFLTSGVYKLVQKSGYPGMKILQFAFDSREESDYLPHNYQKNCVVYTGTHDNDTIMGWYRHMEQADRDFCSAYLRLEGVREEEIHWELIRAAMSSVADLAVIPIQDYLGLGSKARINTPSTVGSNWQWRMNEADLTDGLALRIGKMTKLYRR